MDEGGQQTFQMDSEMVFESRDNDLSLEESAEIELEESSGKPSGDLSSCPSEEGTVAVSTNGTDGFLEEHGNTISESKNDSKLLRSDRNVIQMQKKSESESYNALIAEASVSEEEVEIETKSVNINDNDNNNNDNGDDYVDEDNTIKNMNLEKSVSSEDNSSAESSNIRNSNEDVISSHKSSIQEEINLEDNFIKENICKTLESNENNNCTSSDICTSKNLKCNEKQWGAEEEGFKAGIDFKEKFSNQPEETLEIEKKQVRNEFSSEKSEGDQNKNEENEQIKLKSEENSLPAVVNSPNCFNADNSSESKVSNGTLQGSKVLTNIINPIPENVFSEVGKESEELKIKNDSVQESVNSPNNNNNNNNNYNNNSSTSTEHDGDNLSRTENDGTEIMDTEIVNCNEIELINLNENELQRDKEVDRIGTEPCDSDPKEGRHKSEELVSDILESSYDKCSFEDKVPKSRSDCENSKEVLSFDEAIHQPGNSEEETITGDPGNLSATNLTNNKDKDEDVCIIPDDISPRLSIMSQHKSPKHDLRKKELANLGKSELKIIPVANSESEKSKHRHEEKKLEGIENLKSRPVRNAAKLAGNKIRSLVLNDLVFDEQTPSSVVKRESQTNSEESHRMCAQCREVKLWKFLMVHGNTNQYLCSEQCSEAFAKNCQTDRDSSEVETAAGEYIRKCAQCHSQVTIDDRCLFWETMDFCNEDCLGKYQTKLGSSCANCKGNVFHSSLGKYCVRFGYDVKQFCSASCLEEYKKGLKVCSYCQKDISTGTEGFLAPVGDKGQFKDFCTQSCMEKYEQMSSNITLPDIIEECAVCSNSKPVRVEVELDNKTHKLCSEPCFAAFKFVNNITEGQCDMCRKYFDRSKTENFAVFYDETPRSFCCKTCMNVYILANRKIVPCNWCKVKKYNFDMIKRGSKSGQTSMMCSLNCLSLHQLSMNAVCPRRTKCDFCLSLVQAQYHLTMSDATVRNFCSYTCVVSFQVMKKRLEIGLGEDRSSLALQFFAPPCNNNQYPKQGLDLISGTDQLNSPIPTGVPRRVTPRRSQVESPCVPVISSVQSLASNNNGSASPGRFTIPRADVNVVSPVNPISQSAPLPTTVASMPGPPPQIYQQIITKPAPAKQMKNKSVLCKPYSHTKGVSCRPHPCMKETQTDQSLNRKYLIPVPVPIYVPAPMHMFATPFPVPVPFPLPIPVPIFIPTTRNSAKGIMKEIKKIQEKIPTDPFEAELLMMAEMVAGEKKQDPTDSESEEGNDGDDGGDGNFSPENVDANNTFGDDMLQMALKMASELEEPAVDMESVLTSNTITTSTQPSVDPNKALYASDSDDPDQVHVMSMNRGRKRSVRGQSRNSGGTPSKRGRRTSGSVDVPLLPPPEPVPPPRIEVEKPDANMCLKYTFGVNAWRHWVMQKNAELEKAALTNRKIKLFKPELLQLTADELNFSLCLFVKEVRKPNGTEYAPDTIYYLCLGIQQYLFENGRIDNIFTDSYYEKFTDCLDEVAKKFAALYSDSQYIVTRVEEEHLWESKQLGAHSPHVLLSTLMFFNTKHFNLVTVEEHMQLSFSHIMKHWKRNPNTPGVAKVPGSRNVLLRFYPPQSALEANSRKKKVYEQQENEENPLRCPVKLYEFYLSKCPESVKTRNDVFYLLPERSCVPDSPVWYSTMALGKEPLMKMLHRVKMVKEINIALLTC